MFRTRQRTFTCEALQTPDGNAYAVDRASISALPRWATAFARQRKDARYFEIVEETILQGFDYGYLVFEDASGNAKAVQPYFLLDQDLLAGTGSKTQKIIASCRKVFPKLLTARTLMVGCAAGEGHLDDGTEEERAWIGRQLHAVLKPLARSVGARLIVLKEFHYEHRKPLDVFASNGFTRVPSLPMVQLNIDYPDFDTYMAKALSKVTRKGLRRKFRDAEAADPITLEVLNDVTPVVDEVYPLYLAVYERSTLQFEKLTKSFMCQLGKRMPDKARFFIWRQMGKAIAFSLCLVNGETIYDEYIGLDYAVALDLHLYFWTFRDIVSWAIANGCKKYASSALNYDPKLHFKCSLVPLDLYVAHTMGVINAILRRILPILEPTRNDKTLKQFPNFAEVWGKVGH